MSRRVAKVYLVQLRISCLVLALVSSILILKTCLAIHGRFTQDILCFELNMVEKYVVLKGVFSKRVEMKATFTLKSACLGEKTKRKTNERWEDEYRKL